MILIVLSILVMIINCCKLSCLWPSRHLFQRSQSSLLRLFQRSQSSLHLFQRSQSSLLCLFQRSQSSLRLFQRSQSSLRLFQRSQSSLLRLFQRSQSSLLRLFQRSQSNLRLFQRSPSFRPSLPRWPSNSSGGRRERKRTSSSRTDTTRTRAASPTYDVFSSRHSSTSSRVPGVWVAVTTEMAPAPTDSRKWALNCRSAISGRPASKWPLSSDRGIGGGWRGWRGRTQRS